MNTNIAVRLLLAAGILMLLSGCIFGFTQQWTYTALVWVGAFGCMVAALNFKNRKGEQNDANGNKSAISTGNDPG